jgi:hypothetical protein
MSPFPGVCRVTVGISSGSSGSVRCLPGGVLSRRVVPGGMTNRMTALSGDPQPGGEPSLVSVPVLSDGMTTPSLEGCVRAPLLAHEWRRPDDGG